MFTSFISVLSCFRLKSIGAGLPVDEGSQYARFGSFRGPESTALTGCRVS